MQVLGIRRNGTYILGVKVIQNFTSESSIEINKGMQTYLYLEFDMIIENPKPEDIPLGY